MFICCQFVLSLHIGLHLSSSLYVYPSPLATVHTSIICYVYVDVKSVTSPAIPSLYIDPSALHFVCLSPPAPGSYHMNPYLYRDNVEDQNYSSRNIPSTAYTAESAYYRTRSTSTPNKYSVKGSSVPRDFQEREGGRERERGPEESGRDYLQDSGGGYAPDSAESTDADTYDMKVGFLH